MYDIDAKQGEEGPLILDKRASFSIYCALPDRVNLSNRHRTKVSQKHAHLGAVVDRDELGNLFTLNKYTIDWSNINNHQAALVGTVTNFRVDSKLSSTFDYRLEKCVWGGNSDDGKPVEYEVLQRNNCLSVPLSANQIDHKSLTFKICSYGTSPAALSSLYLTCTLRICVDHCEAINALSCGRGYAQHQPGIMILPFEDEITTTAEQSTTRPALISSQSSSVAPSTTMRIYTSTTPIGITTSTHRRQKIKTTNITTTVTTKNEITIRQTTTSTTSSTTRSTTTKSTSSTALSTTTSTTTPKILTSVSSTSLEEADPVLREKKERERKERERKERERKERERKIRISQLERCKRRVMANNSHSEVRRNRQLKKCEKNAL